MKITAIGVDGFGVWTGLRVEGMSDGVSLIYGPNEAGKTTLMQFVRSVLYGYAPPRRDYLPPVRGGRPGGWLEVAAASGAFRVSRYAEGDFRADPAGAGRLLVEGTDGTRHGPQLLDVLLSGVDEAIFSNVFAVGLRDLQELALLSGTEAASLLYNLSAGLDRVSIVQVMKELTASRHRIIAPGDGACQMAELLARRDKLQAEIAELGRATRHYGRLLADRGQADREAARLEEELQRLQREVRVLETAAALGARFARRAELDAQIALIAPGPGLPEGAAQRLDALTAALRRRESEAAEFRARHGAARREAAGLKADAMPSRQAARIEVLREQGPWIAALEEQVFQIEAEIEETEPKLAAEQERFGLEGPEHSGALASLSERALAGLRQPAGAIRLARRHLEAAKRQAAAAEETALALTEQFEKALSARGQTDLGAAVHQTSDLMARLRRRVQADQRLEQLKRRRAELEEQGHGLVGREVLPAWVVVGLGAVFVLGVVLLLAGLFLPASVTGSAGLALALLGTAGVGASVLAKLYLDRSSQRQIESCQRQIGLLNSQVRQAKEERDALDQQIPRGAPAAAQLEAAERDLAALEELTPLDARRQSAQREAEAAAERLRHCQEQLKAAQRRWREALAVLGLPAKLGPKQVRKLVESSDRIREMGARLARRREELAERRKELDALTGRIAQAAAEAGIDAVGLAPAAQLERLSEALARHEAQRARRAELRALARKLRRRQARHESAAERLRQRRRQFLREAGAKDEEEFRRRAAECARAEGLLSERRALAREIEAAIAGLCPEEEVARHAAAPQETESHRRKAAAQLEEVRLQLTERYEQRGRLAEQLRLLAEDRGLASKRLELSAVEVRIAEATRRWQVLALTSRMLESVRTAYERDRQPETLQEASGYLSRLTGGRYVRVWTPIDEDVLRVDEAEGRTHPVERLSHGTREQLFLSLRLALAGTYARRGVHLPMILDDVLVNFDGQRARAAAAVLCEFAAAGRQVVVFTCHEHVRKLFRDLKAAHACLPDCAQTDLPAVVLETGAEKRPRRRLSAEAEPAYQSQAAPELGRGRVGVLASRGRFAAVEPVEEPEEEEEPVESPDPPAAGPSLRPVQADDEPLAPEPLSEDDFADEGPEEEASSDEEEEDFQWQEALPEEEDGYEEGPYDGSYDEEEADSYEEDEDDGGHERPGGAEAA